MSLDPRDSRAAARQRLFYALAQPTRREIVELLAANGKLSASSIYDNFRVSHPAISQHLKVLREARVVEMEKRAQKHYYRINAGAMIELEDWAKKMSDLWDERFDALDKVLTEEQRKKRKRRRE